MREKLQETKKTGSRACIRSHNHSIKYLGRAWIARDMALATAAEDNIDLLLRSEVNKTILVDNKKDTRVYCMNKYLGIT